MSQINVIQTLNDAHDEGTLSQASLNALTNIPNIGTTIQQGLGVPIDQIGASEVVLLFILLDDSVSMSSKAKAVIDGYNMLLDAFMDSKQQDNILVSLAYLNHGTATPFTPLAQVPRLDKNSFNTDGMTPLFKQSAISLGTVIAKVQEFENNGIQVRAITRIVTDGGDNASGSVTSSDVNKIVTDMLQTEKHIISGLGIGDETFFRKVFIEMGLNDGNIKTVSEKPSDIRAEANVFSQSAVRASQSAANFSQTAMGGFGS